MTILTATSPNVALATARVWAGLHGTLGLAGVLFFVFIVPDEAVWVGLWLDVPIVALMLTGNFLKLGLAFLPGLSVDRRVTLGFAAVAIGVAVTLVKIPVYDEPEGVLFLAFDAVLLALLIGAQRSARR